jgi:hypothetical protein
MPVRCEADLECGGLTPLWLASTGGDINGWAPLQADTLRQAYRSAQGSRIAESGVKPPHSKFYDLSIPTKLQCAQSRFRLPEAGGGRRLAIK